MGKNVIHEKCHSVLLKDHGILKITFVILCSYLILVELYTSWVLRPTYTSTTKRLINSEDFPEVILCPEPPINIDAAHDEGYWGMWEYFMGVYDFWNGRELDWRGNNSEDILMASEKISNLKSPEDCPFDNLFWYKDNKTDTKLEPIYFNITKAIYPYHQCCKLMPPKELELYPIIGLHFSFNPKSSFKVLMGDKLTFSKFDQNKDFMLGDKIVSGRDANGHMQYKVRIQEEEKLNDDPSYPCVDYGVIGDFGKCIEDELIRQNSHFLNCTPPWMTENDNFWCKGTHKIISDQVYLNYISFLDEISVSGANYGQCLVPCKIKKYQVKNIGFKYGDHAKGIRIWFEREVEVTKSSLKTNELGFISKIGGDIGLCKNLLWLIIVLISASSVLMSRFNMLTR